MKKYNLFLALSMLIGILFISCENYEYYEYQSWGWEAVDNEPAYNVNLSDITAAEPTTFTNSGHQYTKIRFTYPTKNVAGQTVTVSAIICMPSSLYTSKTKADFMILANHGAITNNADAPSVSSGADWIPDLIGTKNAIGVEADYIGFGESMTQPQAFAYGDVNARTSLQALICARLWLAGQGFTWENKLANVGFSQGGQTAMHVQKLVDTTNAYGSRVTITKTFAGGGCYNLNTTVNKSLGKTPKLPGVIWLGIVSVNRNLSTPIDETTIFKSPSTITELLNKNHSLSEYATSELTSGWGASLQDDMLNSSSALRVQISQILNGMNCNFRPKSTSKIVLFSDSNDDVVPTENSNDLYSYFTSNGFAMTLNESSSATFDLDNVYIRYSTETSGQLTHSSAGAAFKTKLQTELQSSRW